MKKILIADDHELILQSIKDVLVNKFEQSFNIELCTNPAQVQNKINDTLFDLYILDLEFDQIDGFDLIRIIREKHPSARIIVCTMHQEIWNVNRMMEMGLDGIVLKKSAIQNMEVAVRNVLEGNNYICPRFQEILVKSKSFNKKIYPPTPRELEVLGYIANGYSSREIASLLHISENAIENHRKSLFIKLEAGNAAQLVKNAIVKGLIDL